MSNTADVIVIGGGVHGASLTFHLARRGVKVMVLEKQFVGAGATGRSRSPHALQDTDQLARKDQKSVCSQRMGFLRQALQTDSLPP